MSRRQLLPPLLVFLIGLATILGAWGFQLIGGYVPCKLCLEERVPYYAGVPLALLTVIAVLARSPAWLVRALLALTALVFLYDLYLGGYHAGAEWGLWPGPTDCGQSAAGQATSVDELQRQLQNIHVVSCTTASWRFPAGWGLSFAGWNAAIALVLTAIAGWGALRKQTSDTP